jgi:hypothetical protein
MKLIHINELRDFYGKVRLRSVMKRFLAVCLALLGPLTACSSGGGRNFNTGPTQPYYAFGYALSLTQNKYITPLDSRYLLTLALQGVEKEPSQSGSSNQDILRHAVTEIQAMQAGQLHTQLDWFGNAIQALQVLPEAPPATQMLQWANAGMLDNLDQGSFYIPPFGTLPRSVNNPWTIDQVLDAVSQVPLPNCGQCTYLISPQISAKLLGNLVYMRVSWFDAQTPGAMQNLFLQLKRQAGGTLQGFILDLRFNGNGRLRPAADVAGEFLPGGKAVATIQRRPPAPDELLNALSGDITNGIPIAILVNSDTAGASEMVAGVLQEDHRAVVLGSTTMGSGTVSTLFSLPGGGTMFLTTGRIILPSSRAVQSGGITPNIIIQPQGSGAPSVFGPLPFGEPVNDANPEDDYEVQQAIKALKQR